MRDLHTHTKFSDGKNTPREMVEAALKNGFDAIGISDHSYTWFDESYCLRKGGAEEYRREINALKNEYKGKIEVLTGIEQDYYSEEQTEGYDYVIGSVHYIRVEGVFVPVDESPEILTGAAEKYFGGDIYALTEEYYKTVSGVAEKTGASIIGHFDLISKFNERRRLFDENSQRYVTAWKNAADALLTGNAVFEINCGGVLRGYRTVPFPSPAIQDYIRNKGGKFIISSDSHSVKHIEMFKRTFG